MKELLDKNCNKSVNENSVYYGKLIHHFIENQARKKPLEIATIFDGKKYTYSELNSRANQLARKLILKGIRKGMIVGIISKRSHEMIIAVLALLKIGAVYVPIDPRYPKERIKFIIKDCKIKFLLTQQSFLLDDFNLEIILIDDNKNYVGNGNNLLTEIDENSPAYIIFTSGSTGKPKAVVATHANVVAFITSFNKTFNISEKDVSLQQTSFSFDWFVGEVFTILSSGGKVIIPKDEEILNPIRLKEIIDFYKVSILICTPITLNEFNKLNPMRSIRIFISSSDVLKKEYYTNLIKYSEVYNMYGPTETTVVATYYKCTSEEDAIIPVGKPLEGYQIYILDNHLRKTQIGEVGEIYISGKGVSKGYFNRNDLTEEKFIKNPFDKQYLMYKTGDLGRILSDGNIELIGRKDHQVKIRGYRIEIGEIESLILKIKGIKEVVVLPVGENPEVELVVYFTSDNKISSKIIRDYLLKYLPYYMVPKYFKQLKNIPLTINGKINRAQLIKDLQLSINKNYTAPRNKREYILSNLWKDILLCDYIGIDDNFFELGGNSLSATLLIGEIKKVFNIELSLSDFFKTPTIREISGLIEKDINNRFQKIYNTGSKKYYKTSFAQKRMFTLTEMEPFNIKYNIPLAFEIEGDLKLDQLEKAFNNLIRRHDILRTSFHIVENDLFQIIHKKFEFKLEYYVQKEHKLESLLKKFIKPFDLKKPCQLRAGIFHINKNKHILLCDIHHIIADGISCEILISELFDLYNQKPLPPVSLSYKDYSEWEQNDFVYELEKQENYWCDLYSDFVEKPYLPSTFSNVVDDTKIAGKVEYQFDQECQLIIKNMMRETGSTLYMVLLAALNIVISKYSNSNDIVVGTPVFGRTHPDVENIVGMFVNNLAMRNKPCSNKKVRDFLYEVKENTIRAIENQDYPFDKLVEKLNLKRDKGNPLFDVDFGVDNFMNKKPEVKDLVIRDFPINLQPAKFNMSIMARELRGIVSISIEYNSNLFDKKYIKNFLFHYERILKEMYRKFESTIGELKMVSDNEEKEIINNYAYKGYFDCKGITITEMFQKQVQKTPGAIALVCGNQKLTYRELYDKSIQVAQTLIKEGVKPNQLVGIIAERSLETVVGIFGILLSGGAYLPIDPLAPAERKEFIIKDSSISILLTVNGEVDDISYNGKVISIQDEINKNITNFLFVENSPTDLAYAIYTSGSTGQPKAVLIEHQSVVNLVHALSEEVYSQYDNLQGAMLSPFHFDASVELIFVLLLNGHTLHIVTEDITKDGYELIRYYEKQQIELSDGTPAHLKMIGECLSPENDLVLKHLLIGGERLLVDTVRNVYKKLNKVVISNVYGPTECCVDTTIYHIDRKDLNNLKEIPIGKPIRNVGTFVVDQNNHLVPIGVWGELCVCGPGLARGYLNHDELTKAKFVDNPFIKGERMYKTGDIVRWLPDGNLEFFGRNDDQVKIRGYRIEIGEIEKTILEMKDVKDAVIISKEFKDGEKYLCGYVVWKDEKKERELKSYLLKRLPEYMIPNYIVSLNALPLTPNGKIDKKALPDPLNQNSNQLYSAPRNEIEMELVQIWQDVLERNNIGIDDNFFELGGRSIKATVLLHQIREKFKTPLTLQDVFNSPTIKELSELIKVKGEDHKYSQNTDLEVETKKHTKLYNIENMKLFVLNYMDVIKNNLVRSSVQTIYDIGIIMNKICGNNESKKIRSDYLIDFTFETTFSPNYIIKQINKLINEQEVFKTIIVKIGDKYKFKVFSNTFLSECIIDLSHLINYQQEEIINELIKTIELNLSEKSYVNNLMYNFLLLKISTNKYRFVMLIDHQIADIHTERIIKLYLTNSIDKKIDHMPFRHYVKEILCANNEEKYQYLITTDLYRQYFKTSVSLNNKLNRTSFNKPLIFSAPLVLTIDGLKSDINFNILRILLDVVITMLSTQFKITDIPIRIQYNWRFFSNFNYFNTIGNFSDGIPCTFNINMPDFYSWYEKMLKKVLDKNIRFRELNNSIKTSEFIYHLSPFSLNYLGDYTSELFLRKEYSKKFSFPIQAYSINTNKLIILFNNGYSPKNLSKIANYLDEYGLKSNFKYI